MELTERTGFQALIDPDTFSHELTLRKDKVMIDLHWHLFRPGRARPGLDEWLFEHVEKHAGTPGLDATASLLVMLVHPAITKYLLSPTSMLIHQVDQAKLIESGKVEWSGLEQALHGFGIRTAGWASLYVLHKLAGIEAPKGFRKRIQPGALHRQYLQQWIDRAWVTRLFNRRWLVAGLFSLTLQDSASDAWIAWRAKTRAKSNAPLANLP
jgi:hypothetical protein